jgi:hypothetical protein
MATTWLKRRWLGIAGVGIAAAGVVASVALAPSSYASTIPVGKPCTFGQLPTVQGGDNILTATDRTGRYQIGVRQYWDADNVYRANLIRWHDGTPALGPQIDATIEFTAVSATGVVVGFQRDGDHRHAVAYAYGTVVPLPGPAGTDTTAVAVNGTGQVAGGVVDPAGHMTRVLSWSPDGTVRELAAPAGFTLAQAFGIDEDGTILGLVKTDGGMSATTGIVVWRPDGSARLLAGTRPDDPSVQLWPIGIRDGRVVASQDSSTGGDETLEWSLANDTPQVVDTGGGRAAALGARGSLLVSDGPTAGLALLQNGTARPVAQPDVSVTPHGLSDDDVVYGQSNSNAPAFFDCRH